MTPLLIKTKLTPRSRNKRAFLRASLTIEASLALPIVIFAMALLMVPFKVMNNERMKLAELDAKTQTASKVLNDDDADGIGGFMYDLALDERDVITLRDNVSETQKTTAMFYGRTFNQEVISARRAWVGRNGKVDSDPERSGEEENDPYVWICDDSDVYHSAACFHIFKDFSITTVADAKSSGCVACDRCAKGVESGVAYVLPGMNKYHTTSSCTSMNWKASKVKKSEAESQGRRPCAHCGGGV